MGERIPEPFDFAQGERKVECVPAFGASAHARPLPFVLSEVEARMRAPH